MTGKWQLAILQAFTARCQMKIEQMANFSEINVQDYKSMVL
jgi:hypothetical protein